jgi:hypothetical protein
MPTYTEFVHVFPPTPGRKVVTLDLDVRNRYETVTINDTAVLCDIIANHTDLISPTFWERSYSDVYDQRNILVKLVYAFNLYSSIYNKVICAYGRDNGFFNTPQTLFHTDFICPTMGRTRWDDIYSGRSIVFVSWADLENLLNIWRNSTTAANRILFFQMICSLVHTNFRSNRRMSNPRFLREPENRQVVSENAIIIDVAINPTTGLVEPIATLAVPILNTSVYSRTNMTRRSGDNDAIHGLHLGREYLRKKERPIKKIPFSVSELVSILEKNNIEIPENVQQEFYELALPHIIS